MEESKKNPMTYRGFTFTVVKGENQKLIVGHDGTRIITGEIAPNAEYVGYDVMIRNHGETLMKGFIFDHGVCLTTQILLGAMKGLAYQILKNAHAPMPETDTLAGAPENAWDHETLLRRLSIIRAIAEHAMDGTGVENMRNAIAHIRKAVAVC